MSVDSLVKQKWCKLSLDGSNQFCTQTFVPNLNRNGNLNKLITILELSKLAIWRQFDNFYLHFENTILVEKTILPFPFYPRLRSYTYQLSVPVCDVLVVVWWCNSIHLLSYIKVLISFVTAKFAVYYRFHCEKFRLGMLVKFRFSEKATKFEIISHLFLCYWVNVQTSARFSQILCPPHNILTLPISTSCMYLGLYQVARVFSMMGH